MQNVFKFIPLNLMCQLIVVNKSWHQIYEGNAHWRERSMRELNLIDVEKKYELEKLKNQKLGWKEFFKNQLWS